MPPPVGLLFNLWTQCGRHARSFFLAINRFDSPNSVIKCAVFFASPRRRKASIRVRVEHPFRVIKRQFGLTKVRRLRFSRTRFYGPPFIALILPRLSAMCHSRPVRLTCSWAPV